MYGVIGFHDAMHLLTSKEIVVLHKLLVCMHKMYIKLTVCVCMCVIYNIHVYILTSSNGVLFVHVLGWQITVEKIISAPQGVFICILPV